MVDVILRPDEAQLARFFSGEDRTVFILTNSRALPRARATALVSQIHSRACAAAIRAGARVAFILRGDSTLRGHVFPEIDAIAGDDSVTLFVPAFPEGGRTTVGGIQYIQQGTIRVPVAQTEFARDANFGYRSEILVDWVQEVGQREAISLPLDAVRMGPDQVSTALLSAPPHTVVVPDAESRSDLELIAWGLLDAESAGRSVVVRSAASFAGVRAGLVPQSVRPHAPAKRLLTVCGSHVSASSRQLSRLPGCCRTISKVALREDRETHIRSIAERVAGDLRSTGHAIVATERKRTPEDAGLEAGMLLMDALTETVERVRHECDAVIAKGGITSAETATRGLHGVGARVLGQLLPGVPLWDLRTESGALMPYAVVPGNVGGDETLEDLVAIFLYGPGR
jgi:uncharacterized protein YgbK (DUF1537 family)